MREQAWREGLHDEKAFLCFHAREADVDGDHVGDGGFVGSIEGVHNGCWEGGALVHMASAAEVWYDLDHAFIRSHTVPKVKDDGGGHAHFGKNS